MWYLNTLMTDLVNALPRTARGGNQSTNIAAQSQRQVLSAYPGQLRWGIVTGSRAGLYDISVWVGKEEKTITCNMACSTSSYLQGSSECHLPSPGSEVLVFMGLDNIDYGVVVGVLPSSDRVSPLTAENKMPQSYVQLWDCEPGAGGGTEAIYVIPYQDKANPNAINAHASRPSDIVPGNQAWINEQGVGLAVLNLLLSLKGSDRARLDLSCLDDAVRLISGYYRHINAQGEEQIYNDGGRLTHEMYGTPNQWEKDGQAELGTALWESDGSDPKFLAKAQEADYQATAGKPVAAKKRFQLFTGYLGDLINLFLAIPDPSWPQELQEHDSTDQGVMHTHVDAAGRMQIRSASGISLERCDRIPVPKKKHEPWDPAGDKMEDVDTVGAEGPFEFSSQYPGARSLQMQNARAWRNKQAYQRLHEQAQSSGRKDFYLPEEKDMQTPSDTVDAANQVTADFSKNANRKAYINIEDDGSIIMRDAWGSEIILGYGGITINCAGNITVRSGKSTVVLAGKDFIGKAKNGVELSSTDADVRIKAEKSVEVYGKGVLLESSAKTESAAAGDFSGIILKSPNARVLAASKIVHLAGSSAVLIDGKDDSGTTAGRLYVGVKDFLAVSTGQINLSVDSSAGLFVQSGSAWIAGDNVAVAGGSGVGVFRGQKAWVPAFEADLLASPYGQISPAFIQPYDTLINDDAWLSPFTPANRFAVQFEFRTSAEYGTLQAFLMDGSDSFHLYQATWACLSKQNQAMLSGIVVVPWQENSVNETYPWPGGEVYDLETGYVKVDPESNQTNIENFSDEISKIRKEVVNKTDNLKAVGFNEYEVTQT